MATVQEQQAEFAKAYGLTYEQLHRLMSNCRSDQLTTCLELLRARTHRSGYRDRSAVKLRRWVESDAPVSIPFSTKDWEYLAPKWPVNINIPR